MFISKDKEFPGILIIKDKDGKNLMFYNKRFLMVNYDYIWSYFETKYNMEYCSIQQLIRRVLWNRLKWKVKEPSNFSDNGEKLMKQFKWMAK